MHNLQSDNTQSFSIGIDIGGTFTDIVVSIKNKGIISKKVNSTPEDYSLAAISGLSLIIKELRSQLVPSNLIKLAKSRAKFDIKESLYNINPTRYFSYSI